MLGPVKSKTGQTIMPENIGYDYDVLYKALWGFKLLPVIRTKFVAKVDGLTLRGMNPDADEKYKLETGLAQGYGGYGSFFSPSRGWNGMMQLVEGQMTANNNNGRRLANYDSVHRAWDAGGDSMPQNADQGYGFFKCMLDLGVMFGPYDRSFTGDIDIVMEPSCVYTRLSKYWRCPMGVDTNKSEANGSVVCAPFQLQSGLNYSDYAPIDYDVNITDPLFCPPPCQMTDERGYNSYCNYASMYIKRMQNHNSLPKPSKGKGGQWLIEPVTLISSIMNEFTRDFEGGVEAAYSGPGVQFAQPIFTRRHHFCVTYCADPTKTWNETSPKFPMYWDGTGDKPDDWDITETDWSWPYPNPEAWVNNFLWQTDFSGGEISCDVCGYRAALKPNIYV